MPSTITDRLNGLTTSVAVKPPCAAVSNSNITLSGLQTVGGVVLAQDDRVLLIGQTDDTENGIYLADSGDWTRAKDFDGARDAVQGTIVLVRNQFVEGAFYELTTADPVNFGSSSITFSLRDSPNIVYDMVQHEIDAAVTIVNYGYPPGCVDRYGTNTVPGTTDMSAAFSAAFAAARQYGYEVTWGATAPYRLNSPVNATQLRGTTIRDLSGMNAGAAVCSIIIAHTGHGFDLSHSNETVWNDVSAKNLSGTVPKDVWFIARNNVGSGAEFHRFYRCRTASGCTFTQIHYGYGSEECSWIDCSFFNAQGGGTVLNINTSNTSGYTSTFQTIGTGSFSNTVFNLFGTSLFNTGNSGSVNESCIQLEQAGDFTMIGGLMACNNGIAYIRIAGAGKTFSKFSMRSVRGEPAGTKPTRGVLVETTGTTGVNAHVGMSIEDCSFTLAAGGTAVYLDDAAEVIDLRLNGNIVSTGILLRAKFLTSSYVRHRSNTVTCVAGGTVTKTTFDGDRAQITLSGTDTLNQGFDTLTGRVWETGDALTSASTACTGAITASVTWSLRRQGNRVYVKLPALSAVASAATNFVYGAALPAGYRPPADIRIPAIIILDNGATRNQIGQVIITAATGNMNVYFDLVATGVWTAAANAGLASPAEFSFTL